MSLLRVSSLGSRLTRPVLRNGSKRNSSGSGFWEQNNFDGYGKSIVDAAKGAEKPTNFWKNISLFVALPACVVMSYIAYKKEMEHMSHPRQPFVPYEHLRCRHSNKFPWGDGNHTFFHHPVYNALPDGYEVPDPMEGKEHH